MSTFFGVRQLKPSRAKMARVKGLNRTIGKNVEPGSSGGAEEYWVTMTFTETGYELTGADQADVAAAYRAGKDLKLKIVMSGESLESEAFYPAELSEYGETVLFEATQEEDGEVLYGLFGLCWKNGEPKFFQAADNIIRMTDGSHGELVYPNFNTVYMHAFNPHGVLITIVHHPAGNEVCESMSVSGENVIVSGESYDYSISPDGSVEVVEKIPDEYVIKATFSMGDYTFTQGTAGGVSNAVENSIPLKMELTLNDEVSESGDYYVSHSGDEVVVFGFANSSNMGTAITTSSGELTIASNTVVAGAFMSPNDDTVGTTSSGFRDSSAINLINQGKSVYLVIVHNDNRVSIAPLSVYDGQVKGTDGVLNYVISGTTVTASSGEDE